MGLEREILEGLNPEQEAAVTTTEGPLLILAGAGSGKTTVLTKRIAWILENQLAKRSQILAVTFTNKAAREMSERIANLCGAGFLANVGTFHSVCARWLRREAQYLDVSANFSIYDTEAQLALMREILRDLNVDSSKFPPRDLLSTISRYKNKRQGPDDLNLLLNQERMLAPIFRAYNERLRANDSLDFDDILLYTVDLLSNQPEVREKYRQHLHYILVDEFQDVNPIQYELLRLLIGPEQNFCVVGDDDQSIYGFRGADISIILRFEEDFPQAKVVKLEQNYRSTQQILDVANAVVGHNTGRKAKELWSQNREGHLPCIYLAENSRAEARFVISACKLLVRQCGYHYSDIAILYRTNFQSRSFEDVLLREEGIAYEIVGGRRFYDRREVRDILAYLQAMANPSDSIALGRIIANTPGIGEGTLHKIVEFAAHSQMPVLHALALADRAGVGPALAKRCRNLYQWLQERSEEALDPQCQLFQLVGTILQDSGYRQRLVESELEEDKDRVHNIDELLNVLSEFDKRFGEYGSQSQEDLPLRAFLSEVSLLSTQDELGEEEEEQDKLLLMTVHTSKGLEFPIVFLVGLEEGLLPHRRSLEEGERGIEEERRLCYVGLTRAKELLYITAASQRLEQGYAIDSELSRFMYEAPGGAVEVRADEDWRSRKTLERLRSGEGFRAAERQLVEEQRANLQTKGGAERQIKLAPSANKTFRRRQIALKFPPGCTVTAPGKGKGRVAFIASGKLWVRFEGSPGEVVPVPYLEAQLLE